jgi:pilus assembly protein CpaF
MRPNRIIVGEVRGEEAIDMLSAFNTGHDGSLCTGHSNSTKDMLTRLEMMVLFGAEIPLIAIRKQIVSSIDIIIQLGRLRDKSRTVLEISEIVDIENQEVKLNKLYEFKEEKEVKGKIYGTFQKVGELWNREKLFREGYN